MHGLLQHLQEDDGKDEPGSHKDSNGVVELTGVWSIGFLEAEAGDIKGRVGHPEATIRGEN